MSRLHRGQGCPFCGKSARHAPSVRRTSPDGTSAVIVDCDVKGGGNYTWSAKEAPAVPGVDIRAFIRKGILSPANSPDHNPDAHLAALAFANSLPRRRKKRKASG